MKRCPHCQEFAVAFENDFGRGVTKICCQACGESKVMKLEKFMEAGFDAALTEWHDEVNLVEAEVVGELPSNQADCTSYIWQKLSEMASYGGYTGSMCDYAIRIVDSNGYGCYWDEPRYTGWRNGWV